MGDKTGFVRPGHILLFWEQLWSVEVKHNRNAVWLQQVKAETSSLPPQGEFVISPSIVCDATRKMRNWAAPGHDQVHPFWVKHFTSLHTRLAYQFQDIIKSDIPLWVTSGRTVLLLIRQQLHPILDRLPVCHLLETFIFYYYRPAIQTSPFPGRSVGYGAEGLSTWL